MTPIARWLVPLTALAMLLGSACSDGDDGAQDAGTTTTTTIVTTSTAPTPSTTVATGGSSTTIPAATTTSGGATTSVAPATTLPTAGAVATAGGWRMVITQPAPLSTVGAVAVLCYEVTGPTRESTVAFDVTILAPIGIGPFRAEAAVGRGTARATLTPAPTGRYDLRIQLIVDGARLDGAVVTIAGVNVVAGGTQTTAC